MKYKKGLILATKIVFLAMLVLVLLVSFTIYDNLKKTHDSTMQKISTGTKIETIKLIAEKINVCANKDKCGSYQFDYNNIEVDEVYEQMPKSSGIYVNWYAKNSNCITIAHSMNVRDDKQIDVTDC